jgi:hypothetical protein
MSKAINLSQVANAVGVALGGLKKAEAQASVLKESINKMVAELHSAKAKVGTYQRDGTGCAIATAFVDGCVEGGLSQATAQKTYLPTFKKAVKSGEPIGDWNGQRARAIEAKKAKEAKEAKGGKASQPKSLANKLATCYRDAEFAEFADDLQTAYDNDEGSILECIKSYLEIAGVELKDVE